MKIVTYNVNGLRPRISQFGSLSKLLNSLDADIICFQETKIARQELRADLVSANGYESFFSCTRTTEKGRTGYSGVATFCRVKSAFSSNEVALPVMAEEGFTGLLENSHGFGSRKEDGPTIAEGLEGFSKDELLEVDCEGRCVITDHGHFVLFNIYGPRAGSDDAERIQFKRTFFKLLQKRWECLLHKGRRIIVVGDLNIAPAAIDRCDADSDFEKNEFRRWFRSLLMGDGGPFFDVFRAIHPDRREAYTCWPTNTGAEVFNFGTRIDHILITRSCLHDDHNLEEHNFVACHVKECDILTQFKRWKSGDTPRWKGERSLKLEGSDHAPVYTSLREISNIAQHNTPYLSARYCPQVYGCQQTLASVLMRRQSAEQIKMRGGSACLGESHTVQSCDHSAKRPRVETKKKGQNQWSQLSLRLFFQKTINSSEQVNSSRADILLNQADASDCNHYSNGIRVDDDQNNVADEMESNTSTSTQDQDEPNSSSAAKEKRNDALLEWQRIQQFMRDSIPLCKGHHEPCVARVVKKAGPNLGRRFYVCARAEGPASNPEANCGYFKWAASKSKDKR